MRTLLALLAFIMFFFSREITLIQEMVFNLRASLHERIMDMAFPSLLLVSFVTGIYFIYLIPFPRGWMRWMAILVLCLIYQLGAQNQALFRPRYLSLSLFLMFLLLFDVVVCHSIWFMDQMEFNQDVATVTLVCFAFVALVIVFVLMDLNCVHDVKWIICQ